MARKDTGSPSTSMNDTFNTQQKSYEKAPKVCFKIDARGHRGSKRVISRQYTGVDSKEKVYEGFVSKYYCDHALLKLGERGQ